MTTWRTTQEATEVLTEVTGAALTRRATQEAAEVLTEVTGAALTRRATQIAIEVLRVAAGGALWTNIDLNNPLNGNGVITEVQIYAATNMAGVEVGIFYNVAGNVYSTRSWASIGNVTAGSAQSFDVELPCETGDYIGIYYASGTIEMDVAGAGIMVAVGDQIPGAGITYALVPNMSISLYGYGKISRVRRFELESSRTHIYNDVRITRTGGTEQTAYDGLSAMNHGYKIYQKSGLALLNDGLAQDMADYILSRQKDPHMRLKAIGIAPQVEPDDLFPKVLDYEISDAIWVKKTDAVIDEKYHIEGIQEHINFQTGAWWTLWWLTEASGQGAWILGTSELGLATALGF